MKTPIAIDTPDLSLQASLETRLKTESGLACRAVGFSWNTGASADTQVLHDLNLDVKKGEFISVIGPSGCGKSTLLSLLCGLAKPGTGQVLLDGMELTQPTNRIGIVFQNAGLFPWLNVLGNVAFSMKMKGLPANIRSEKAKSILEKVGLWEYHKKFPHELSGGMKQRVSIARALANHSEYLLMDEPFAALDYQTRFIMQDFLMDVWRQFGKTIIFVTHHVDESIVLSDRIFLMTAVPGTFVEEIVVDLPRPRDITSVAFNTYRSRITNHLEKEVSHSFS